MNDPKPNPEQFIPEEFKGLWLRFFTAALCGATTQEDSPENHAIDAAETADCALEQYKERFL